MNEERITGYAYPLANATVNDKVMNLLEQATSMNLIRKGANEVAKSLNRGLAKFVVLAADTDPIEFLLHIPLLCEDKMVPYVFIKSKQRIGKACGLGRDVIACSIASKADVPALETRIKAIEDEVINKCL